MASSSARMDVSGRTQKRTSLGSSFRSGRKTKFNVPYLGFESKTLKPVLRSTIDVDARFLPYGISPGMVLEIKGPEKSGKTFLLTYFIARLLCVYPEKKAVLIDTRHKFNVKNYLSLIRHFDADLKKINLNLPMDALQSAHPKLKTYLDRLSIIPCYSAEDLMLTFGPAGESVVQQLLQNDPAISLIAVDAIDMYSFAESLKGRWAEQWSNIMGSLKESVSQTKCPVICTSLIPANKYEYKRSRFPRKPTPSSSALPLNQIHNDSFTNGREEAVESNFPIDYSLFTTILELVNGSKAEREKNVKNANHFAYAYLRSRHNANTAGSGGNHRVKFSIFSDMLWVAET